MNVTSENTVGNQLLCAKCNSDNTQNISLLISAGTKHVQSETSSSGVAISLSGRVGYGSSTSHTSSVVVSELASKFKEPDSFANKLQVFSSSCGAIAGLIAGFKYHSFWTGAGVLFAVGISLNLALNQLLKSAVSKNEEKLKNWKKWSDTGYFCHRCGHAFIPGSNEAYVFEVEDE